MTATIKSLCAAGLLLGACTFSSPTVVQAQGKGHDAAKVERKVDRQIAKDNRKVEHAAVAAEVHRARRMHAVNRHRMLCEDGTWSYSSVCAGHGGLASRQYQNVPHASAQAIMHANPHSAVARRAAYANGISTNAIARCNDGTFWHAINRTNACYRHGGVARWF